MQRLCVKRVRVCVCVCVRVCVCYPLRWTPCVTLCSLCLQTDSTWASSAQPLLHTPDLHTHTHTHIIQCIFINTPSFSHKNTHTRTQTHTHTRTQTHKHKHTHTHTHTHTDHCVCRCVASAAGWLDVGSWSSWQRPAEPETSVPPHERGASRSSPADPTPPCRHHRLSPPGGSHIQKTL